MTELIKVSDFLYKARRTLRFGKFSRLPVRLLRLEWRGDLIECDWQMRAADPWDADIPARVAEEQLTLQALRDAINLRDILFRCFPEITTAELRMFRPDAEDRLVLAMTGTVNRSNEVLRRVASLVMRARLCGFRFTLDDGALTSMHSVSFGCL
jgi:hypothetical protein